MTEQEKISIKENIEKLKAQVRLCAEKSGRSENDIRIVLATKTQSAEKINYAAECGISEIGENRVQELLEKYEELDKERLSVHFIGTLQTNKVKYIIDKVCLIHSVNSINLAAEINRRAEKIGKVMDVLIEINAADEKSKTGISDSELSGLLEFCSKQKNLHVRGLMAIPPAPKKSAETEDNGDNCCENNNKVQINIDLGQYFNKIVQIFLDISAKKIDNINMDILSLGMSQDYTEAILSGSNLIRPGRAVFGERK